MKYLSNSGGLVLLGLILSSVNAMSASFNCQKAATLLEKSICADTQLSFADEFMGYQYFAKRAATDADAEAGFKSSHRRWLKGRVSACPNTDANCLLKLYAAYSEKLSGDMPALWRRHKNNRYTWWASFPPFIYAVNGEIVGDSVAFDNLFDGSRAKPANKAFYQDQRFSFNIESIRIFSHFQLIQTLDKVESETYVASYSTAPIALDDFNFDGHRDMAAVEFLPAGPNIPMHYWLYQPASNQYVYSKALSAITSATFLTDKKRISSHWRSSCCHHGLDIYSVIDGEVIKLYQQSFNCDLGADACIYTLTRWVDGQPVVVKTLSGLRDDFDWSEVAIEH